MTQTLDITDVAAVQTKLADLEQQVAALGSPSDVVQTYNAQAEFWRQRSALQGRIGTIRRSAEILGEVEPQLASLTMWRNQMETWRSTLAGELLALPSPIRADHDRGRLYNLTLSIRVCDCGIRVLDGSGFALETLRLGQLMRESGYVEAPPTEGRTFGTLPWVCALPEVDRRLAELQERCADARTRLEAALRG